jgi:hypothetical protein
MLRMASPRRQPARIYQVRSHQVEKCTLWDIAALASDLDFPGEIVAAGDLQFDSRPAFFRRRPGYASVKRVSSVDE